MTVFETERLRARPWTTDDAEAAFEIYRDEEVVRFLGSVPQPVRTLDEARERIGRWLADDAPFAGTGFGRWALVRKDDDAVVGTVVLRPLPDVAEVEVGWHLGRQYWGGGYATEGAAGGIEHGFTTCGLDVVYAVIAPENTASVAVARRLGMTHEGPTDAYYGKTLELFSIRP